MTLRLRTWVLAAAALVLVPMVLLLLMGLRYAQQSERSRVEAEVRYRVGELVHSVNERIAVSVQALQTLANSEAARQQDWAALYENARRVADTHPYYEAVTLVDAHDRLLFVTAMPYGRKTFNTNYVKLVHEVFETGLPNVSGPFRVPISEHTLVAVSVPVLHQGQVSHVVRMILRTDSINQLLDAQQLPPGWLASVADRDGQIVARSLSPADFVGKPASATFQAAIARNDQRIYRGRSLEGVRNTSLVLPIYRDHWFAVIAVPDPVLEQVYQRDMLIVVAAIVGMCLLGVVVALGISHFLSRQALALEQVVHEGRPDTPLPWPLRITEMQRVYESYRDVSSREQQAQGRLSSVTHEKDEITDLYDHAPCGYHSLDANGVVVRMNQTELNWLGRTREQVLGQPFVQFVTEAGRDTFKAHYPQFLAQGHIENLEFELLRADGSVLPVSISGTLIRGGQGRPLMSRSTVFDITERKRLEQHLQDLSNHDTLTGLPNRRHFYELAAHEMARGKRYGEALTVAMLDVDHFKQVNDQHGHAMGDLLLQTLASVCRGALRQIDVMARFGGEEFVVLMPGTELTSAVAVLDRLRTTLQAQQLTSDQGVAMGFTVSIGVTAQQAGETDIDAMLKRADAALYEAKRLGRNQVRVG